MSITVFAGPSLAASPAQDLFSGTVLPPVRCGDVYAAVRDGATCIGIIDGVFEQELAVWHKEILWALQIGVPVVGAASIGALRAVELLPYGMRGIGQIFEWYLSGAVDDDGEVAVLHAPAELGYQALSEPLVNVRATLSSGLKHSVFDLDEASMILGVARSLNYKERTRTALWEQVILHQNEKHSAKFDLIAERIAWLDTHWIDQKRIDAEELLATITRFSGEMSLASKPFEFSSTVFWRNFKQQKDSEKMR